MSEDDVGATVPDLTQEGLASANVAEHFRPGERPPIGLRRPPAPP
jgi:hypothetical protein